MVFIKADPARISAMYRAFRVASAPRYFATTCRPNFSGSNGWNPVVNGIDYSRVDQTWIKEFSKKSIPLDRLCVKFIKSSGPGGQNVNKVNTKVEMRFNLSAANWLPKYVQQRLRATLGSRINSRDEFHLSSDRYRTQKQNLDDCVTKLESWIKEAGKIPNAPSEEQRQRVADLVKAEKERNIKSNKIRQQRSGERQGAKNWRKSL